MKLIDNRGKLFGIVNLIDLSVLLLIILVTAAVFVLKFNNNENPVQFRITLVALSLRPEVAKNINANEALVVGGVPLKAKVKDVKIKPSSIIITLPDGTPKLSQDPINKDAIITVEGQTEPSPTGIRVGGQEVRIGKKFSLRTEKYEFETLVTSFSTK